jgi:FkbM family methyltransferase
MKSPYSLFLGDLRPLLLFDVGARNASFDLTRLHADSCIVAFEPNPAEFERMKRTAARVETGAVLTFPTALATESGTISLNISRRVGASSTLMPNAQFLSRFKGDAYHEMAEITDVVDVPATTLSAVAEDIGINHIDFLKLDTQGNEYYILAAAGSFLRRVSVIKDEV